MRGPSRHFSFSVVISYRKADRIGEELWCDPEAIPDVCPPRPDRLPGASDRCATAAPPSRPPLVNACRAPVAGADRSPPTLRRGHLLAAAQRPTRRQHQGGGVLLRLVQPSHPGRRQLPHPPTAQTGAFRQPKWTPPGGSAWRPFSSLRPPSHPIDEFYLFIFQLLVGLLDGDGFFPCF